MSTNSTSITPRPSTQLSVKGIDLDKLLNHYDTKIKVLSLDCFDTLLFRSTLKPIDVFYALQNAPTFKQLDFSANMRITGEIIARDRKRVQFGCSEVTLKEIYLAHFPNLSAAQINALSQEELAAEKNACFAFPPAMALIRSAVQAGLKIVVVSDTYFSAKQLGELLDATLPKDCRQAIQSIFCSCEHGKSKSGGLFSTVLNKLNIAADKVLHIGDNEIADFVAPQQHHMHATHFVHYTLALNDIVRMQALAANIIDPEVRQTRPMYAPYRGIMALNKHDYTQPEVSIGYATLGPIMHSFAQMVVADVKALAAQGKRIKVAYLLRDAHLPGAACDIIAQQALGQEVRISRFTAYAASWREKRNLIDYLAEVISSERYADIAKQLLLDQATIDKILASLSHSDKPQRLFVDTILRDDICQKIFTASKQYRQRFFRHLEKTLQLEAGTTLMLVDLGYSGTAQRLLTPVLKDELNVDLIGRYLLAMRVPEWQSNRRGLIDPSWCDDRTLLTLVSYIALLEQLCTTSEKSAIDFDEDGNAIYATASVNQQQFAKLTAVQAACLEFIKDAENFFAADSVKPWPEMILRDAGMGALARLIFLPTQSELEFLQAFEFDLNLGTDDIMQVFNCDTGLQSLRQRGMFFMEKNLKSMRTNYPSELRYAGLELAIMLMTQHRYAFDFTPSDWSLRRETISIIVMRGQEAMQSSVQAIPTYDGYFSMLVPLTNASFQLGILWGLHYKWLQIADIQLIATEKLYKDDESLHSQSITDQVLYDQIEKLDSGLIHCQSSAGLMLYMYPGQANIAQTLRIVYRPLAKQ